MKNLRRSGYWSKSIWMVIYFVVKVPDSNLLKILDFSAYSYISKFIFHVSIICSRPLYHLLKSGYKSLIKPRKSTLLARIIKAIHFNSVLLIITFIFARIALIIFILWKTSEIVASHLSFRYDFQTK